MAFDVLKGWPRRRGVPAFAGPVAIVAATVLVLAEYVAGGLPLASDIPYLWTPTYCYLGETLRSGTIPAWDPYILAGTPFAADPQPFGWLYLLPMALFTFLPCGAAMALMILAQPVIAGLACYAFVRLEGMSRVAATVGGLALSGAMAGSKLVASLPIGAAIAYSMLLLAALSWFLRASTTSALVLRSIVVALVFGQLAAAHLSVGLAMGSLGAAAFVLAKAAPDIVDRRRPNLSRWAGKIALLVFAAVAVNLALFLPRAAYVPRTTLGLGYQRISELSTTLAADETVPRAAATKATRAPTAAAGWPLELGTAPGSYLGAAAILLSGAALWSRRFRPLVVGFVLYGTICHLLPLTAVADVVAALPDGRLSEFYLHQPHRLGYHILLALAVLAAIGLEAWVDAPARRRMLLLLPGTALLGLSLIVKGSATSTMIALVAWAAALVTLAASARRRRLILLLAVLLAVELVVASAPVGALKAPQRGRATPPLLTSGTKLKTIPSEEVLSPGPIARALMRDRRGRYVVATSDRVSGLNLDMSNHFRIEYAGGYSSAQRLRYWIFLRAATREFVYYNRSYLTRPPDADDILTELLDITAVIADRQRRVEGGVPVAQQGSSRLYALQRQARRASLVNEWRVVADRSRALEVVTAPGFDPRRTAVVESPPTFAQPSAVEARPGVRYEWVNDHTARVAVTTREPAVLLVRNVYDPGWKATVDGRPVEVIPTDYVVQGIPVPVGTHTVELHYEDPWIVRGLWSSGVSVALLLAVALLLRRSVRRHEGESHGDDERDPSVTVAG